MSVDMKERPFFSVVIPVYNRATMIRPTLESVRTQTFGDFECIVVDDGSMDGDQLKSTVSAMGDPRFRYVRRENGGGGAARNTGIDAAAGMYIAFLDSDDRFLSGKLENDFSLLSRNERPDVLVFSQVLVDRGSGACTIKPARGPLPGENLSEYLVCAQGWIPTPTMVVPTSLARAVRFREGLPFAQDTDFALRIATRGAAFLMHDTPGVLVDDRMGRSRTSLQNRYEPLLEWLEDMRGSMSVRAYYAYRGWHVARMAAQVDRRLAWFLYFQALIRRAFPFGLAAKAFVQIAVPRRLYRWMGALASRGGSIRQKDSENRFLGVET